MKHRNIVLVSVLTVIVLAVLALYLSAWSPVTLAAMVINSFRSARSPHGTLVTEPREGTTPSDAGSWPSYNRTLTSERYSPLSQINTQNVRGLKVLCSYDTHLHENFNSSPIMVDGALIGTTAQDIFSIDASNCKENWRTHEDSKAGALMVNRGAAYLEGRLFRGTVNGRVVAYDIMTGKRLWGTQVADPKTGEILSAAPIAWNGLVFIGNALGDVKGVRGRMYALAADSGRIVWETYLVPKAPGDAIRGPQGRMPASAKSTWKNAPDVPISGGTTWTSYTLDPVTGRLYVPVANGAPDYVKDLREGVNLYTNSVVVLDSKTGDYINHFPVDGGDWHDWDVSNTPSIFVTRGGKQLLSLAPKNGHLYGFDLATAQLLYRTPVTRIENADVPLSSDKAIHFCPGATGGGEWNGVAYDPQTNLVYSGQAEWCSTVKLQTDAKVKAAKNGEVWLGNTLSNPVDFFGKPDPIANWAGWVYATDADSGEWKWRVRSNYPTLSGITPTAGGIVFFGDMGENFYALDASNGTRLWAQKLDGAVGGGVITYAVNGSQKVAVAVGINGIFWPTRVATAKIVILGLGEPPLQ